jgi:hypothetical protein
LMLKLDTKTCVQNILSSEMPDSFMPDCKNPRKTNYVFSWKKLLPSAGIKPGSSQSKRDHASHLTTVNPQTEGYIYE